ncbi:DNA fragmentation factor subunit alpha [Nothoprocta perdicaria]|uniref:DNA fragmentation factor subunit alpha n=1 Tax=Nothoprocta perdicaria TaxID=30464 RepID=UPI000E1C3C59|nr:DNA fragmentation factor subunit alpha [Nothoprocta perdicaria]
MERPHLPSPRASRGPLPRAPDRANRTPAHRCALLSASCDEFPASAASRPRARGESRSIRDPEARLPAAGGGPGWLEPLDEVDGAAERWRQLARRLRHDLSSVILMAEGDLQVLIDVPPSELAEELEQSQTQVQALQDTLQQVLDRREEERQSRQLLELYLQALKKEESILSKAAESGAEPREEMDVVDTGTSSTGVLAKTALSDQTLAILKGKPAPELCLDSQDLELVVKEDTEALASALSWDKQKAEALQQACDQELSKRLQQVQTLHSLRSISKGKKTLPWGDWPSSKRKK